MYHHTFETEWDSLGQEEAMFRAFALGVDAAFGEDHEDELAALEAEFHRGLIQVAYDEGRTRAREELREKGGTSTQREAFEPGDPEWEVWEELIEKTSESEAAFEPVEVSPSRVDPPEALDRPGLLDRPDARDERITLPRFLLR